MPQIYIEEVIIIAVQFEKTGVVNASGEGVNPNIIPGTWAEEKQYSYPSSSYSDKFSPITTIIPTAPQYTLSFYAKSTVAGDKIRTHYYSPNTTTTCVSSQGITKTAGDGNMTFELSTKWERYWVTYSQSSTTAVKHVICPRMGSVADQSSMSGTGIVSIKMIKLEEGSVPTPWCPNEADAEYVGTTIGFSEANGNPSIGKAGYVQATEFIEW